MFQLQQKDAQLIKAFITREAEDYGGRKDINWIEDAYKQVITTIEKVETTIHCKIRSMGNAGVITRTLSLDINNSSAWDKYETSTNMEIVLCSCGNLDHLLKVSNTPNNVKT